MNQNSKGGNKGSNMRGEAAKAKKNVAKLEIPKGKSGGPGNASGSVHRGEDNTRINK